MVSYRSPCASLWPDHRSGDRAAAAETPIIILLGTEGVTTRSDWGAPVILHSSLRCTGKTKHLKSLYRESDTNSTCLWQDRLIYQLHVGEYRAFQKSNVAGTGRMLGYRSGCLSYIPPRSNADRGVVFSRQPSIKSSMSNPL